MLVGDPHDHADRSSAEDTAKLEDYMRLQYEAIRRLQPDLVVLMGDNASGNTAEEFRQTLVRQTLPYAENDLPFAFVLGNHDLQKEYNDIKKVYDIYRELPGCLLPGEEEVSESGDYHLTIASETSDAPAFNLWFMYSGDAAEKQYYSKYDFVKPGQIAWYERKARELAEQTGKLLPAVLFQHIPVPEEYELCQKKSALSMIFDGVPGLSFKKNEYYTLKKGLGTEGYMGEAPCAPEYNSGQFASWKKTGDIVAAFFGHDHMNDFVGMVDGLILGQCRSASFNVYGDGLMQGVRVLDLSEKAPRDISTKIAFYRDFFGDDCRSIHGTEKTLRDRTSVKLEAGLKGLAYVSAAAAPAVLLGIIRKIRNG